MINAIDSRGGLTRRWTRLAVVALIAATACYSSKQVKLTENPDARTRPAMVEVRLRWNTRQQIHFPVVGGDSIRGWRDEEKSAPVAFALSDVRSARTRQFNEEATGLLTIAAVLLFLYIWITVELQTL